MTQPILTISLCAAALLLGAGCQHGADHAAHDGHGKHESHDTHAAHGAGHDLKPLMRTMLVHVVALQDALTGKDVAAAGTHATALAEACKGGDEHAHHNLPAEWGPDFVTVDRALHQGAEKMSQALKQGDLAQAQGLYVGVVGQCQACHAQAPAAQAVRLGRVLESP